MCKTKTRTDATNPQPSISHHRHRSSLRTGTGTGTGTSSSATDPSLIVTSSTTRSASSSSRTSLSSLHSSLSENPHIYSFSEISSATNNFLSPRLSSAAWRCSLRHKDVVIIQRKFHHRRPLSLSELRPLLSSICKSHHSSIINLLGASLSGHHIYLVYDHIPGANLSNCLRNPKNPNFTVLHTWLSRIQIATDLAQALQYIHHYSSLHLGLVHNHIKSSSIIISDPNLNAKICHFGTAQLTGESPEAATGDQIGERKVQGTRGYMAPELLTAGIVSQKSDVFAFGVVMLEILSGEEPLRYRFDDTRGDYERVSLIEKATDVIASDDKGRFRRWIDGRLRDSFPIEVAEMMTRVALDCVHVEMDKRPDMDRVAGMLSKLYLESKEWAEKMRIPTDFTVSMAPR